MEVNDIYNLYSATFGLIKKDNKSWQGFIKMLSAEGVIDHTLYTNLKQRNSFNSNELISESKKIFSIPSIYKFLIESDTMEQVQSEEYYEDEENKNYDLTELLNNINTVIIKHYDDIYKYLKSYDKFGFVQWVQQNDDEKSYYITEDMIEIIKRYTVSQHYNMKKIDDFLNISKDDFKEGEVNINHLYNTFMNFYNTIFERTPKDLEDFTNFINYAFDSGLVDYIEKDKIIKKYGENGNQVQAGTEGQQTS